MADGLAWDELTPELDGPGVGIRRMDAGGRAACLIRLDAGLRTDPLFAGLPDNRCQCEHWGYIISGTMRVHSAEGARLRDRRAVLLGAGPQPGGGHRR